MKAKQNLSILEKDESKIKNRINLLQKEQQRIIKKIEKDRERAEKIRQIQERNDNNYLQKLSQNMVKLKIMNITVKQMPSGFCQKKSLK